MNFEIVGEITEVETIAVSGSIRIPPVLRRRFGPGRWRKRKGIAICIKTDDPDLLTPRRIYQVLPDEGAARSHYVRVIDDEGEDYLYPADYVIFMEFPPEVTQALLQAS
jgi:hypothetical protein